MPKFYQVDSAKVSLREYWWGNPSPLVIIGWLLKWLRIRIPGSADDANTESTLPFVAPGLPADIQAMFAPLTQQVAELGFQSLSFTSFMMGAVPRRCIGPRSGTPPGNISREFIIAPGDEQRNQNRSCSRCS